MVCMAQSAFAEAVSGEKLCKPLGSRSKHDISLLVAVTVNKIHKVGMGQTPVINRFTADC